VKRAEKEAFVADFEARLKESPAFYLTDFSGLNVQAMTRLRRRLKASGADYIVVKNRLALRVIEALDYEVPGLAEQLNGPTGVVVGKGEAVEAAKVLAEFAKEHENRPVFKVGVMEQKVVAAAQFQRLAKLPPRTQLLAELVGAFQAPMAALAGALAAKLQETVGLVEALRERKAAGEGAGEG
jgi:large subunit ribosomal protein L10